MQPSPTAETSRWLSPSARVFIVSHLYTERAISRRRSVMLPSNSPVFIGARRPHDQLRARQLEPARQVLAYEAPDQCALDVIREAVSAFVDLVSAERGLVSALRVLHRPRGRSCLLVSIHDLDRHAPFAREDEHPGTVGSVNVSVGIFLFEPGQPPGSDEPVPYALVDIAILAAGQG